MTVPSELIALIDGERAGVLSRDRGRLTFTYDHAYSTDPAATPLSVSLPLVNQRHSGAKVSTFVSGLLPDSDAVRARWAAEFQTRDTPFDLLCHVGEDCAGGVQFVRPDRLDAVGEGGVEWLTDSQIGDWVRDLRRDPSGWLRDGEFGQFSLAGAQSKFALCNVDGRWGRPFGSVPTTHIVKPASSHFAQHEVNEHLSLELARRVGLSAARSDVVSFDGEQVVVVERFDRFDTGTGLRRVHQEDLCQATGCPPEMKYENQGGPSIIDIAALIRRHSTEADDDLQAFVDATVFNWVIANTDAHAKNYGFLLATDQCRLAPLYDLASALPYVSQHPVAHGPGELDGSRLNMAMSLFGTYRMSEVRVRDWLALFSELDMDPDNQLKRAVDLSSRVAKNVDALRRSAVVAMGEPMVDRYVSRVFRRANLCSGLLLGRLDPRGYRP